MRALQGIAIAALIAAATLRADAQEGSDSLELTIVLLPEDAASVEDVVRQIDLPAAAAEQGREASADGRERAEQAGSEQSREGRETAAEARERGREFGQDIAEQARENRENAGREDPGPPDGVPNGPPDDVGPPNGPPGSGP